LLLLTRFSAQAIARRILSAAFFLRSTAVGCYLSMPHAEARTAPLISEILQSGQYTVLVFS